MEWDNFIGSMLMEIHWALEYLDNLLLISDFSGLVNHSQVNTLT